jgi:aminoglycoside 2''-phosphotransferase
VNAPPLDLEPYRRAIEDCFPQIRVRAAVPILDGWDNLVLEVNAEFMFRFPRRPAGKAQLEKEILLLSELAGALPIPVPAFEFVAPAGSGRFVGYRRIEGVPLAADDVEPSITRPLARQLARFLSELHRFSVERAPSLNVPCFSAAEWRQSYCEFYETVAGRVLPLLTAPARDEAARCWEGFLDDRAHFQFRPVLVHGDLACEHVLWDRARGVATGVIDWGDARVGDPALDFVGLFHDLGRDFAQVVLEDYRGEAGATFWERVSFYTRIMPFYEVLFGPEAGDEDHTLAGLSKLEREFSPQLA